VRGSPPNLRVHLTWAVTAALESLLAQYGGGDYFRDVYGSHMMHLCGLLVDTKSDSLFQAMDDVNGIS
jgi:hypothetical protein